MPSIEVQGRPGPLHFAAVEPSPNAALGVLKATCHALARIRGEASTASLAEQVIRRYAALDEATRVEFFSFLLDEFSPDPEAVDASIEAYREFPGPAMAQRLADDAEAPRLPLFRSINTGPGGMETLLRMRADCIAATVECPELRIVERDMAHLLGSWFNRGFLRLEQIDWETPAVVLEKLIEYEAVHEIRGWDDLHRRLQRDRRCFGFFHPSLPNEPLIFVEVALTRGLQGSIQAVIDAPPPRPDEELDPDTAIFYSITNCQAGLQSIPLGSFLIKRVTAELGSTVPSVGTFSTLSPVPGFRAWVDSTGGGLPREAVESILAPTPEFDPELEDDLVRACARYLVLAKRRVQPRDPVARFHLRNGARLERINWGGDLSEKGLHESFGMLVNYVYDPAQLTDNHEAYVNEFRVAHSEEVGRLALA